MKDKKTVICVITGKEILKSKSKIVAGHRVKKEAKGAAKGLLIDGVNVFVEHWVESQSSASRLGALAYTCAIIKAVQTLFDCEPTIFVVEIHNACERAGKPLDLRFSQKILDYISGEEVYELNNQNVKRAIRLGSKAFIESVESYNK